MTNTSLFLGSRAVTAPLMNQESTFGYHLQLSIDCKIEVITGIGSILGYSEPGPDSTICIYFHIFFAIFASENSSYCFSIPPTDLVTVVIPKFFKRIKFIFRNFTHITQYMKSADPSIYSCGFLFPLLPWNFHRMSSIILTRSRDIL